MKQLWKKLTGADKVEAALAASEAARAAAERKVKEAEVKASAKTPKELATDAKEPWVEVLKTHINSDNVRNGFFELDWNEFFIEQLKMSGYKGETDESIIDQWFKALCRDIGAEEEIEMSYRGAGYVNTTNLGQGKKSIG